MLQAAEAHYRLEQRATALGVLAARRTWDALDSGDLTGSWRVLGGRLTASVAAAQLLAARDADRYLAAVLAEQNVRAPAEGRVNAAAFTGVAGDGRDLASLLYEPVIAAKSSIGDGASTEDALTSARSSLDKMVATAVQDAARAAVSSAVAARPRVTGYVRMLNTPSCTRCVVLAGRWYRWNAGFSRHPRCDCRHVPASEDVAGDLRTDPLAAVKAGQVTGLSKADTRAILRDGADVSQVVNAHRGMSTAQVFSERLKVTTEGSTLRGARSVRLMPESIYRIAPDRGDAIRMLRAHGFIL